MASIGGFYLRMTFTNDNYIVVQGFAINDLKLAGNELLCYSLIYGFTQDGESAYQGGLSYIASALNISKNSARSVVERLVEKGHLQKIEKTINNVKFCDYVAVVRRTRNDAHVQESMPPYKKLVHPVQETCTPPLQESCTNNITKNKIYNTSNIAEQKDLHGDEQEKKSKTTLFRNSEIYSLADIENKNYSRFEAQFKGEEYRDIDLVYYFHSVADWSDSSNTKRTARGWLATIRNFIRGDIERGRLHRITQPQKQEQGFDFAGAAEFLKM